MISLTGPRPSPGQLQRTGVRFAGYAALFDRPDRGGDVIRKGAFAASLAAGETIPLLWQHRAGEIIGRVEHLSEDERGLRVIGELGTGADARRVALLFNADEDSLAMGANAVILGREAIQFSRAEALGGGHYRLSGLLRGRRGSEWAMAAHIIDEPFVLLDPHSLALVAMDRAMLGGLVEARAYGIADDEADPPLASVIAGGESLRPLSPCQVRGTIGATGLTLNWLPRRVEALSWVTGDDPDTSDARYSVSIERGGAEIVREVGIPTLDVDAAELAALGSGDVTVAVIETGPTGASRPALLTLAA